MKQIIELRKSGASFRHIASVTGLSKRKVLKVLVESGVHKISFKKVRDGFAVCTKCNRSLALEMFPNYTYSQYQCKDCYNELNHKYQIKKLGCSVEQYEDLLKKQGGSCAICKKSVGHISCHGVRAKLSVDHNHETGKIRGLLCGKCNRGLGWFSDSIKTLYSAIRYLNETQ